MNVNEVELPMRRMPVWFLRRLCLLLPLLMACASPQAQTKYHDPEMDFSALRRVAVMPFANLTPNQLAAERVRDAFITRLMATNVLYVIPPGEVARGINLTGVADPAKPSTEEVARLAPIIKADAVITGVVREYGEVRSGATAANVIAVSASMFESASQKVVWTASSHQGGISMLDRLLGTGGQPMDAVTRAAIDDLIDKLLY